MRKLIIILSLFALTCQAQIEFPLPEYGVTGHINPKSFQDNPTWTANYNTHTQLSLLDSILIYDGIRFLSEDAPVTFNKRGFINCYQDASNYTSINMSGYGGLLSLNGNILNGGINLGVSLQLSAINQSIYFEFSNQFRYGVCRQGFFPTQYSSPNDQWLGTLIFPWYGLVVNRNAYFLNMPQGNVTDCLITLNSAGQMRTIPMISGNSGTTVMPLDTIRGSVSGRVVWNETGVTNKEVMAGFENLTTDHLSIVFPIPFNHFLVYGDPSVMSKVSVTNGYLKVENTNNLSGLIYIKGY